MPGKKPDPSEHQEMRKILRLAVSCKFLTPVQEKEILPKLMAGQEKNPGRAAAHFLFKERVLPKDKIELLFAVKHHLDVLMQDRMFGKLGVANEFVSQEKVDKALDLQVKIFRQKKKSIKIGDILENIRGITPAHKTAILLTQDRIRDELLQEALNAVANTEMEKLEVNRRFGAIAVKKKLITPRQLNKALKIQEKELKEKGIKRYLGEILKELFKISDTDVLNILKTQKSFETKRLDLNKKFARYYSGKKSDDVVAGITSDQGVIRKENRLMADRDEIPGSDKHRTRFVTPMANREINGDITENTDESHLSCMLTVRGNIARGVSVSCHGLLIEGDILGNVTTTGDIEVKGNIGEVFEPGKPLPEPILIKAGGSIRVGKNIMNAGVFAEKGVNAPNSDIMASEVSSFQNIIVKNVVSIKERPSLLKIGRKNFFKIDRITKAVDEKAKALNRLLYKSEQEKMEREVMHQVQIRDGYMEKQNVISYLKRILSDPDLASAVGISEKIKAASGKRKEDASLSENTKARAFMEKIEGKIKTLGEKDQDGYVRELSDNIIGMVQSAVKETKRMGEEYEARLISIRAAVEKAGPEILDLEKQIESLLAQRDLLLLSQEPSEAMGEPLIKVKNRVDAGTLIKGERSELEIESPIHGVSIKEDGKISKTGARIVIEGYFE